MNIFTGRKKHKTKYGEVEERQASLELCAGDRKLFNITKIRVIRECNVCGKTINKGSVCLGSAWIKICLDCALKKFLPEIREGFSKMVKNVDKIIKDLDKNKDKYSDLNMLASLG